MILLMMDYLEENLLLVEFEIGLKPNWGLKPSFQDEIGKYLTESPWFDRFADDCSPLTWLHVSLAGRAWLSRMPAIPAIR